MLVKALRGFPILEVYLVDGTERLWLYFSNVLLFVAVVVFALGLAGFYIKKNIDVEPNYKDLYEKQMAANKVQTERIAFYEKLLSKVFERIPATTYSTAVTVTAYSARPEETNSEPWYTADMSLSRVGMLAVSRDILEEIGLEYGEVVVLEGYGVFKIHDTMNKRWKRRVDILMANAKAAKLFGKQQAMLTWIGGQ